MEANFRNYFSTLNGNHGRRGSGAVSFLKLNICNQLIKMQTAVGWVVEKFLKYEVAKPTVRYSLIGLAVVTTGIVSTKIVKKVTEKKLSTSGYVLISGGKIPRMIPDLHCHLAASGLGYICTVHLAEQGFRVIAGVRKEKDIKMFEEVNKTIKYGSIIPIMLDVSSEVSQFRKFL